MATMVRAAFLPHNPDVPVFRGLGQGEQGKQECDWIPTSQKKLVD